MIEVIIGVACLTIGYLVGWYVSLHYWNKELSRHMKIKPLAKTTGYFNLFKDKAKKWRFNILASNFKVIASSEGYDSKRNAVLGMKSVVKSCSGILDFRNRK